MSINLKNDFSHTPTEWREKSGQGEYSQNNTSKLRGLKANRNKNQITDLNNKIIE